MREATGQKVFAVVSFSKYIGVGVSVFTDFESARGYMWDITCMVEDKTKIEPSGEGRWIKSLQKEDGSWEPKFLIVETDVLYDAFLQKKVG